MIDPEVITRSKDTAKEKHGLRFSFEEYSAKKLREVGDTMLQLADDIERLQQALIQAGKLEDPYQK